MKYIKIDKELLKVSSKIQLGCIQYETEVEKGSKELWNEIDKQIANIEKNLTMEEIYQTKNIKGARNLYKAIGKDPHRYRISSEALLRRIV